MSSRPATSRGATNVSVSEKQVISTACSSAMPQSWSFVLGDCDEHLSDTEGSRASPKSNSTREGYRTQTYDDYWDVALRQQKQNPNFLAEIASHSTSSARDARRNPGEAIWWTPPARENTVLRFPAPRDDISPLLHSTAEGQAKPAKAVYPARMDPIVERALTESPDSDSSGSSSSIFSMTSGPYLSDGTAITALSSTSSPLATRHHGFRMLYDTPLIKDRIENKVARAVGTQEMIKELHARIEENRTRVSRLLERLDQVHSDEVQPKKPDGAALRLSASPCAATFNCLAVSSAESEQSSRSDPQAKLAQKRIRATPWRTYKEESPTPTVDYERSAKRGENEGGSVVTQLKPCHGCDDVKYRGDKNVSWPSPPPTALLQSDIPSPVPFSASFVDPTTDVGAIAPVVWPSPPPPSLLRSDIPSPVPFSAPVYPKSKSNEGDVHGVWPSPPPPSLLRSDIPSPVPFQVPVVYPTCKVNAGDVRGAWPSPPPLSLLQSDIPRPVPFLTSFIVQPTSNAIEVKAPAAWPSPPPPSLLRSDIPQPVPGVLSLFDRLYAVRNAAMHESFL